MTDSGNGTFPSTDEELGMIMLITSSSGHAQSYHVLVMSHDSTPATDSHRRTASADSTSLPPTTFLSHGDGVLVFMVARGHGWTG